MSYANPLIKTEEVINVGGLVGNISQKYVIQNSYVVTGSMINLDGSITHTSINEKPIGNIEDTTIYDIEKSNADNKDKYVGFNFDNLFKVSTVDTVAGPVFMNPETPINYQEMGGAGTKDDPYLISTQDQFFRFTQYLNDTSKANVYNTSDIYYQLGANIYLTEKDFNTIQVFNANFNGKGFTIYGLHIETILGSNVAFIGENNGLIRDVYFANATIVGENNVAGVVATNNGVIHGVVFDGIVVGRNTVGGVVATNGTTANAGTLVRLGSHANVSGHTNVGGVVGYLKDSNLNSYNDVFAVKYDGEGKLICNYVGITESYSRARVVAYENVGGVVGYATNTTQAIAIKNVYNTGEVYSYLNGAGIVGFAENIAMQYMYSYGDIVSYNENVTGSDTTIAGAGHIVGYGQNSTIGYQSGGMSLGVAITPKDNKFIYLIKDGSVVASKAYGSQSNSVDNSATFDYETLQIQTTFTNYGFNFTNIWRYYDVENNFNYKLPILKYFHSYLVVVKVGPNGGYLIEERFGTVNENGEIYVLNGENLEINFLADKHYHIYRRTVNSEVTLFEEEFTEESIPDNTFKQELYTVEYSEIVKVYDVFVEFTIDKYKFTFETNPETFNELPIGTITLLNEDGTVNDLGIYEYDQVVIVRVEGLDNFKLLSIDHVRTGETDNVSQIEFGDPILNGNIYSFTSTDGHYNLDETRDVLTTADDFELNYSTESFEFAFNANDFTSNGYDADAEGVVPPVGKYVANFIKQYDVQLQVQSWDDITLLVESADVTAGGYIITKVVSTGAAIVDETGFGVIDEGTEILLESVCNKGYLFVDYSDGVRAEGVEVNSLSPNVVEKFVINKDTLIVSNFDLVGLIIKLKLNANGSLTINEQDLANGGYIPVTYDIPGVYETTVKYRKNLNFLATANTGYAVDTVTHLGRISDETEQVFNSKELYEWDVTYEKVLEEFTIEITFRHEMWTDHPSDTLQGSGTIDDPYLITNGHDLGFIANQVNDSGNSFEGKYFKVVPIIKNPGSTPENPLPDLYVDAIDLSTYYFKPMGVIGNDDRQFKGTIYGDYKSFENIRIDGYASQIGFFISPTAYIENLFFENVEIYKGAVGTIVGAVAAINNGTLKNVSVSGIVESSGTVAGLVGINYGTLERVMSSVAVTNEGEYAGGISAINYGTIRYANNLGKVINTTAPSYVGGIAGLAGSNNIIELSANYGELSGDITGGIVGEFARGSLSEVYNTGKVVGNSYAGGIFAYKDADNDSEIKLSKSYNAGRVSAAVFGGIFGYVDATLINNITDTYYINLYEGSVEQTNAVSKTLAELQDINTFESLDFETVWGKKDYSDVNYNNALPFIWDIVTWGQWSDNAVSLTPEDDVYHISTSEQLAWISQQVNTVEGFSAGKTFVLDNDINMFDHFFTSIGTSTYKFEGVFDGKGHTISGLSVNTNYDVLNNDSMALFGYTNNATIKDLTINTIKLVANTNFAGAVVGSATNTTFENVHVGIEDEVHSGLISSLANTECVLGGIVGELNGGSITKSMADINIYINNGIGGGLVGKNLGGEITLVNSSSIIENNAENAIIGGLIGENTGSIADAFYEGVITSNAANAIVGGIVGRNAGEVHRTYANINNFTASGTVGGVIGENDTYTTAEVAETDKVTYNYYSSEMGLDVKQGFGKANTTGFGSFVETFYLNRAEMKTDVQLRTESTYSTWDFDFTWAIDYSDGNLNDGYPLFYYNNDYQIVTVTVTHDDISTEGADDEEYGQVIRLNYNKDGEVSSRAISRHGRTEEVYVLNGNYVGFDVAPYYNGLIESVIVDGVPRAGLAKEKVEFDEVSTTHDIEVLFIKKLYKFVINGVIDAAEGYEVSPDVKITAIIKNIDTGSAYFLTLSNGDTKILYNIARGRYIVLANVPMFHTPYMQIFDGEVVQTDYVEVELTPTSSDATITITLTKTNERWLNDSANNYS